MYDILFDFSSSPLGGSIHRLEAYAEYFSKSPLKTHFFIHEAVINRNRIEQLVSSTAVHKSLVDKLILNNHHLKNFNKNAKWLFSYGIPTKIGFAKNNWLHISNVLPFTIFETRVNISLRIKMLFLLMQFKTKVNNNKFISAESNFSIERYVAATGWGGQSLVLLNGIRNQLLEPFDVKESYAIAVGSHTYKRLDNTYLLFKELKEGMGLTKLVILGDEKQIPKVLQIARDVEIRPFAADNDFESYLKKASCFISTSEVENSSYAVQEGLQFTKKAILSNIPSHREMLKNCIEPKISRCGIEYLLVERSDIRVEAMTEWSHQIEKMLISMGFRLNRVC